MHKIFFNHIKLNEFKTSNDYSGAARLLLSEQLKVWSNLSDSYNSLRSIQVKSFQFEGYEIKVQHNPGRVKSSTAKVDDKSIKERKCFLCSENLYPKQKGIDYGEFIILVNPFPIASEHFTIPHKKHIPQSIKEWFGSILDLSKDMQKDVVIYNGPRCGASAPDHLHFQAVTKYFMPVDNEFHSLKNEYGEILFGNDSLVVSGIDDNLRRIIAIETAEKNIAEKVFQLFYSLYEKASGENEEPMMNILSFYEPEIPESEQRYGWRILIVPRGKHRPSFFFSDGEDKILWSPAAIDFGGVGITPFEKDFHTLDKTKLEAGFNEVSISTESYSFLKIKLKEMLFHEKF